VKTNWTRTAVEHLVAIYEHIAQDAPLYAQRVVDRLTRRSEQIAKFPGSGRTVPEYDAPDIREVIERPYRIIYRVRADQIDVLAVVHGAQRLPPSLLD
jgi:addiction module RelE/StbE family toxin